MGTFSELRPASREEIEASASLKPEQAKASKAFINVSLAHRHLARRQFLVQHYAYWLTVCGLVVAEASTPVLTKEQFWWWLASAVGTWAARLVMFIPLTRVSPSVVQRSFALKLVPVFMVCLASTFWVWTISLYSGPAMTVRELFLVIGLLSISLAMAGMWPVTPVAVVVYNVCLWGAFGANLYRNDLATLPVIAMLIFGVFVVLWLHTFIAVNQLKYQLEHSRAMQKILGEHHAMNTELEKLKDAAFKTLDKRSGVFREASHDFQQRLHAVKLWVLDARAARRTNESDEFPLQRLGQEIDSLQVYVAELLDYARMETLDPTPKMQRVALQSVFQRLDLHFERIVDESATPIESRVSGQPRGKGRAKELRILVSRSVLHTDVSMLERILQNLISNALKFTRRGVLVCARRRSEGLAIEVWDQGKGIKPEAYGRIFEAFHQEDDGEEMRMRGVGVGLAIVRRFVDSLGYQVEVRSVLGRGTRFRVLIPASSLVD
ncbi:HAMP domain-containing sensor histidine kinase [Variovorax paradoxus]|uniref:sensor histidine kinase n=1 Tax=Variovorax paradoxus TaxID=34073 RepID=UPI001ABCBEE4